MGTRGETGSHQVEDISEYCPYNVAFPLDGSRATRTILPKLQGRTAKQGTALVDSVEKIQVKNCKHRVTCSPRWSPQQLHRDDMLDLKGCLGSPINLLPEEVHISILGAQ